jgi:NitT/TauT family transport system substrate-binding protein
MCFKRVIPIVIGLFVLAAQPTAAQDRINIAYTSPTAAPSSATLWLAKDAGIFKKHGLDANLIYIQSSPKALMAMFAGEVQVVAGTGPAVPPARIAGGDATMIMGFEVTLPYYLVVNPAIKTVEDLRGKIGANQAPATSGDFAMRLALKSIGFDPDKDVSLRVIGATVLRMITMQKKQADFTVVSVWEREAAEKMGFKVLVDLTGKKIPYFHSGFMSSQKMLRDKRDAMMRFGRATVEAIQYLKNNKPQTIAVLKKYSKTDPSVLDMAYTYMKGVLPDLPYPTVEGMKTILAEMGRTRPEALEYDAATMVDSSIVKAVDDEGFLKGFRR